MARQPGTVRRATERTVRKHTLRISLPCGVTLTVPSMDRLAFYGGIGLLAVVGIVDWPVATVLIVGHALADSRHSDMMQEFGKALEEA